VGIIYVIPVHFKTGHRVLLVILYSVMCAPICSQKTTNWTSSLSWNGLFHLSYLQNQIQYKKYVMMFMFVSAISRIVVINVSSSIKLINVRAELECVVTISVFGEFDLPNTAPALHPFFSGGSKVTSQQAKINN